MDITHELAWAAGFFDGEGSTTLAKGTNSQTRRKPRLTVPQKTTTCLLRFQRAIGGLGTIYGPIWQGPHAKYVLSIQNASGVDIALSLLWPYLSDEKKAQALRAGYQPGVIRRPKIGRPRKETA